MEQESDMQDGSVVAFLRNAGRGPDCSVRVLWIMMDNPHFQRTDWLHNRIPDLLSAGTPGVAGARIRSVKERPSPPRKRRLAFIARKAITSYYAQEEKQEIADAAKQQGITMSSFVASAALKEARRLKGHA